MLLAQEENNLTVKRFQRSQQHKLQAFLLTLQSPDPAQQKRAREEVIRIRKQLQEIFQNTLLLYSNVHAGAIQLSQKSVTEILIHFGPPKYEGEYEQITQLVRAIEAADSWEVGQADEKAREAIYLATEIKLRRAEAADELLFDKAFHQVVKGAEKISVEAASDQEGFDLCHTSSEDSSAGFENSDLPLQEDKSPKSWHLSRRRTPKVDPRAPIRTARANPRSRGHRQQHASSSSRASRRARCAASGTT